MQPPQGPGMYKGFKSTAAMMRHLAQADPSVGAAFLTAEGYLA